MQKEEGGKRRVNERVNERAEEAEGDGKRMWR